VGRGKFSTNTNKKRGNQFEDHYSSQSVRPGEPQLSVVDGHKPCTLGTEASHRRLVQATRCELLQGRRVESAQHFEGGGEEGRTWGAIKKPMSVTQSLCKTLP